MTADLMTDAVARLRRFATARPDAVLLATRGRVYTYAEMLRRAGAVAAALRAAGGERGRRVALYLEEYDQFFVCMLGAWLAGTLVVPLNMSLPQADADWLIAKAAPDVLVLPADDACPGEGPVRLVVTADDAGLVDGLRPAGETAGAGGEPPGACSRRAQRGRGRARGRAGDDHVHVGHDRPAQGRLPDAARRLQQRRSRGDHARAATRTTASSSTRRRTSRAASATS